MAKLATGLVIAVDIGFAKDGGKSCGVAWKAADSAKVDVTALDFCPAITKVSELLKSESPATLIVEAPLFALFSVSGNPIRRGDFEELATEKKPKLRYWYHQGGATPCLASIFFLRQMRSHLLTNDDSITEILVYLYEGFISFKSRKTSHKADAAKLLKCFVQGPKSSEIIIVRPEEGQSVVTLADIISDGCNSSEMPLILKPH